MSRMILHAHCKGNFGKGASFVLLIAAILMVSHSAHSQDGSCIDLDGDGWGWNGVSSCRASEVVQTGCIDHDGDGWGWDGSNTCAVTEAVQEAVQEPAQSECIDFDGDGFGWNGVTTCTVSGEEIANSTNYLYRGVTESTWDEIDIAAAAFGDNNNCRARVSNIPSSGHELAPCDGNCITDALRQHDTVILLPGVYRLGETVRVGSGKTLTGTSAGGAIVDASNVDIGLSTSPRGSIANLSVHHARNLGIRLRDNSLLYRVSVRNSGTSSHVNENGSGVLVSDTWGSCIVSVGVAESYNESGGSCSNCATGGNADGFAIKFGAGNNTVIDGHATRNSDDGFDFWLSGGSNFVYFSSAFRNGGTTNYPQTGDGSGFKMGIGNVRHYVYRSVAYENDYIGFDFNLNQVAPRVVNSEAYNNGFRDWAGVERL